jgi:hypothetical protein
MSEDKGYVAFAVKHCKSCNHCWEREGNKQLKYWDFPKYGLEEKTCNECKKKELSYVQK